MNLKQKLLYGKKLSKLKINILQVILGLVFQVIFSSHNSLLKKDTESIKVLQLVSLKKMDEYKSLEYKPSLAICGPKSLGTLVKWYNYYQ